MAFLGRLGPTALEAVVAGVALAAAGLDPAPVTLGPATATLGDGILVAPVGGLEPLAEAVAAALGGVLSEAPSGAGRPFRGHLTLARARGDSPLPESLVGRGVTATWTVREVAVVASTLHQDGARYRTLATAPLGSP